MRALVAWFAHNRVAANLLMLVMVAGGLFSIPRLVLEVFPELEADVITVEVEYPGSTPVEVEELICIPVEEAVHDLEGIERLTSKSQENKGVVSIEVEYGYDVQRLLEEVKSRVDAVTTFPAESERPVVARKTQRREVIGLALSGPADERGLKALGERVRDEIATLPGISQVELVGDRDYEISAEVPEDALRRHGLTLQAVAEAIARQSLNLSGGAVKDKSGDLLLRTEGQAYRGQQFAGLPIYAQPDGAILRLGDLGGVVDGFAEIDTISRFDGRPALEIAVYRVGDQNVLDIAAQVRDYVARAASSLPEGMTLSVWRDRSDVFNQRLSLMAKNGLGGLVLVLILLALFLKPHVAFWVAMGIPVSFLATIWVMPGLVTLNMMTMFAFVLVLGIVVDDAIVVGENVCNYHDQGQSPTAAAVSGASEVAIPVVFAVLTTVAAFVPLLRVPGELGQIWRMIPLVVIPCLLFSLVESLLVLPAHLAMHGRRQRPAGPPRRWAWSRVNEAVNGLLQWLIRRVYQPTLRFCGAWRYLTLALFIGLLLWSVSLVGGGRLKFTFWPEIESDQIVASLEMKPGTPQETTATAIETLEKAAWSLNGHYAQRLPEGRNQMVLHVLSTVTDDSGQVRLQLLPTEERLGPGLGALGVAERWMELTGPIPEAASLGTRSSLGRANRPIEIQLAGRDMDALVEAAAALKRALGVYPGVTEVLDSFRAGKREIKLTLKPQAVALGLSVSDLARQVRQAFYGAEAQRFVRGRDEVKVMVRYPEQRRRSLAELEDMRVRTPAGDEVPLSTVASLSMGEGFAAIERAGRSRVVTITAKVLEGKANANEVVADLRKSFLDRLPEDHPGVSYRFEGLLREQAENLNSLAWEFGLALFFVFVLLAVPLRSYLQPAIIMGVIPFSAIGVIWGHMTFGMELSIYSVMGFVALAGVVVNDSLVMVDYINRKAAERRPLAETLALAGGARMRPILLTSLTTFGGLMPLLLEPSRQAKFLAPMAISLGCGVIFATCVSLILVPVSYLILEDFKAVARRAWRALATRR